MAEIAGFRRKPNRRLQSDRRQSDRRRSERRRSPRRRDDRPRTLLIATIGLAIGAYAALTLRTAHLSEVAAKGQFAVCGAGVWRECVIDGDTIRLRGATIRLADINAPETKSAKCRAERELGRKATERLQALLNAGPFTLARAGLRDSDKYGRKLRILRRDGRSLGDILVTEGLAHPWTGRRHGWCG